MSRVSVATKKTEIGKIKSRKEVSKDLEKFTTDSIVKKRNQS
jgi:hypothetical protein